MAHLIPVVAPARCTALVAILFLSAMAILSTASAQALPAKERHTILVRPQGNTCVYQIMDQSNQDLFVIRPNGAVILRAQQGLWVDVSVEDADGPRNAPGNQNRRSFALRQRTPQDAFTVRGSINRTTEHRIQIQCCPERGARGRGCPAWQDAQPYDPTAGESGGGSAFLIRPDEGAMRRGPAAPEEVAAPPTVPPGGPVMRVEEEN